MEVKIRKNDFQRILSLTQNVVEKKSTMPILANVLLEASDKRLRLNATDLEVGVSIDTPVEVIKDGRVTVFAKALFDIIRELPDEIVNLKTLDNSWVEINCGKSKFKLVAMKADEFPSIPEVKSGEIYTENRDRFLEMLDKTSFAMSTDETRYNLNGVYLETKDGGKKIRTVATDGHRLSISEKESDGKLKLKKGVIIPRKGVMELRKLLENSEGEFSLRLDDKNILVEKDNVQLFIRLIEGQFPPYEQVVPKNNKKIASIDRELFIKSLKRVALMASDKTKGVKLSFSPGHLDVSTSNPDYGEAREDVDITYKGETFSVGFNAKYFTDILNVIDDEKVVLELKDDVSPCLIRSEFDKGLLNVIMPMRM